MGTSSLNVCARVCVCMHVLIVHAQRPQRGKPKVNAIAHTHRHLTVGTVGNKPTSHQPPHHISHMNNYWSQSALDSLENPTTQTTSSIKIAAYRPLAQMFGIRRAVRFSIQQASPFLLPKKRQQVSVACRGQIFICDSIKFGTLTFNCFQITSN